MVKRKPRQQLISPAELRALRKSTGLPMTKAAVALGIGYSTLRQYEKGLMIAPKIVITVLQVLAAKREAVVTGRRKDMLDFLGQPFDVSL